MACNVIMTLRGMMGICMDGTGLGPFSAGIMVEWICLAVLIGSCNSD